MWYEHQLSVLVPLTRFTIETKKYLMMWSQHHQLVLAPHTSFAYEMEKTSPCGMSTGCQCWYHLQGLLMKPKKTRDVV
jgi:hypothetical protein